MPSTARAAWIDAWEGASTPSPYGQRYAADQPRCDRYARQPRGPEWARETVEWAPPSLGERPAEQSSLARAHSAGYVGDAPSVARMSSARRKRSGRAQEARRVCEPRRPYRETRGLVPAGRSLDRLVVPDVAPISDYDWEAAARRRPAHNQCERVILHADREIDARMSSTRYYGREATARVPEPWPHAERRETVPRLRVVKHKMPRRRLGALAVVFAVLLVGLAVVAPMMMSSAVAGVEAAVGQAEAQQQQLAADTAALAAQISSLASPQRVAEEAAQLGLVPAADVSYLSSGASMLASEGDTTVAGR